MFKKYLAIAALSSVSMGSAFAAVTIIPQSALIPTQSLYTTDYGTAAIMTGGGNAANVGTSRNDDGYMGPNELGFTLNFFGGAYTQYWANNNGNISFTAGNSTYIPAGPIGASIPTISIWFGDVDTRNSLSGLMYTRTDPNQLIVTWDNVGSYNSQGDQLNTFQMVVRGDDYSVPEGEGSIGFFWLGMPWEVTDTSTTAAIGFGNGSGDAIVLAGSNEAGLNEVVAYHQLWFNRDLTPVCGVPGTPPCENGVPEPGVLYLLGIGLLGAGLASRRRRT